MLIELYGKKDKARLDVMSNFFYIAVNYNGFSYSKSFIESINNMEINKDDIIKIIIVDNHSSEEDFVKLKRLSNRKRNVQVLRLRKNIGYFKGLNEGIKTINKDKNTVIIVGNNDLTFERDFIKNYKKISYENDVLVIAPNIITKEGRQQNPHVVEKVSNFEKFKASIYYSNYYIAQVFRFINQTIKKIINKPIKLKNNYGQMEIKRGIGACYILTPNFSKHFEKLDDRVFMWGEEALLSNQVESVNGCTLYDPSLKIIHHESASVSSIQSKEKYYMVRDSYKIYKKYL